MKPSPFSIPLAQKFAVFCAIGILLFVSYATAFAQMATFSGTQRPVALGFSEPEGVAVDQFGNLFVADLATHQILEIVAVDGAIPPNPTVRTIYANSDAERLAVDTKGNIYFTYHNNQSNLANDGIMEIVAVNGSIPSSPTVFQIGSGFYYAEGLAVDANGDVFVADTGHNAIKEMLAVNGSVPTSPTIINLGSGFISPRGVAVDALGNVYVGDTGNKLQKR